MGLPVLVVNPSGSAKGKRKMARRKFSWADAGLVALGAVALSGVAYAVDGLIDNKMASGFVKVGTGALVGGGVSMVNRPLGAGIAGSGIGLGTYDLAGEALGALAKAPAKNNAGTTETKSIRANIGNVHQLPRKRDRVNVSAAAGAVGGLKAIRAKLRRRA